MSLLYLGRRPQRRDRSAGNTLCGRLRDGRLVTLTDTCNILREIAQHDARRVVDDVPPVAAKPDGSNRRRAAAGLAFERHALRDRSRIDIDKVLPPGHGCE